MGLRSAKKRAIRARGSGSTRRPTEDQRPGMNERSSCRVGADHHISQMYHVGGVATSWPASAHPSMSPKTTRCARHHHRRQADIQKASALQVWWSGRAPTVLLMTAAAQARCWSSRHPLWLGRMSSSQPEGRRERMIKVVKQARFKTRRGRQPWYFDCKMAVEVDATIVRRLRSGKLRRRGGYRYGDEKTSVTHFFRMGDHGARSVR